MDARLTVCERTVQFVSLELDGELSRFERAVLDRHLQACPRCAAEAETIAELTRCLRAAPLEHVPAPIVIARPRRRVGHVAQRTVAAMAVAVMAVWLGLSTSGRPSQPGAGLRPSLSGPPTASSGRYDWPAGLPQAPRMIQLIPGGLYTSDIGY